MQYRSDNLYGMLRADVLHLFVIVAREDGQVQEGMLTELTHERKEGQGQFGVRDDAYTNTHARTRHATCVHA